MPPSPLHSAQGDITAGNLAGIGHAVGHGASTHVIIQNLVLGYGALSTRYDGRVKNFLEFYLGTADHPVPFGGRAESLQALDAWLADDQAPHYALLAAPAGRGKSALLAQGVERIALRDAFHIIYFPISIRFNTNLEGVVFAALAARAAHLFGEQVALTGDAQQYRGLFTDFLRRPAPDGKPILVIVDGLDEAAGWEWGQDIFPPHAPAHLRVLIAARPLAGDTGTEGWVNRLGWAGHAHSLPLPPLTRAGMREVLENMGNPLDALAAQLDVVATLHRLSEGDPLLVRLYVEALRAQGELAAYATPEVLTKLEPGLDGYFRLWWEEQHKLWGDKAPLKERSVRGLLNLCATALGPLHTADVLHLARDYFEDAYTVEDAARPLARLVIGDGQGQGYAFSHPRLSEYFAKKLGVDLAQWQARFVRYGRETLEQIKAGTLTPQAAASTRAYALRHYAAHLQQSKAPSAELYALLCSEWAQAWEALDGTYAGFLTTLETVWVRAQAEQALGPQVRCALFKSSIFSLSANISPELLALAMANGVLTLRQGLVHVQHFTDFNKALERLQVIALQLSEAQLKEALGLAQAMGGWLPAWGAMLLGQLAKASPENEEEAENAASLRAKNIAACLPVDWLENTLALPPSLKWKINFHLQLGLLYGGPPYKKPEMAALALAATHTIQAEGSRAVALTALAPHLPLDLLPAALAAAHTIQAEGPRAVALTALAPHLPSLERAQALTAARAIQAENSRAWALVALAPHLPPDLLAAALAAARAIQDEYPRAQALIALALHLPPTERATTLASALAAARAVRREDYRAHALTAITPHLPALERAQAEDERARALTAALAAARAIQDENYRSLELTALAPHLSPDLLPAALDTARAIQDEGDRARALAALAPHLSPDLLPIALDAARTIQDEGDRARVLAALAPHLSPDLLPIALDAARAIQNRHDRAQALTALAPHLPPTERAATLAAVLDDARAIQDAYHLAQTLTALAPHLPPERAATLAAVLEAVLDDARAIQDEYRRARALTALVPHLPPLERTQALTAALAAARAIQDEGDRVWALTALTPHLPPDLLPAALDAARAIRREGNRVWALAVLAPHLPSTERAATLAAVLDDIPAIQNEYPRAQALTALAPHLSPIERTQALTAALEAARVIQGRRDRAAALAALAPHLSPIERTQTLTAALTTAHAIQDEGSRAQALTAIAPHLSLDLLPTALDAAHAIQDARDHARALIGLAPGIEKIVSDQPQLAYGYWGEALRELAHRPRPEFLKHFKVLLPLTLQLGPEAQRPQLAADIAQAILDVAKWWP